MLSKLYDTANQFISAAGSAISKTTTTIKEVTTEITEKADNYLKESLTKVPDDCSYITSNLIVMGFPGKPVTRKVMNTTNNRETIAFYLENRYEDHYRILNLTEEEYDTLLFQGKVENVSLCGFPCPSICVLFQLCEKIETWLNADERNVMVLHCYDGNTRSLLVAACYLVWISACKSTTESVHLCLDRRGLNENTLCPSQMRYLEYFDSILSGSPPSADNLRISRITIIRTPDVETGCCSPFIEIYSNKQYVYSSYQKESTAHSTITPLNSGNTIIFKPNCAVEDDVMIRCRHLSSTNKPITLFRSMFFTGYIKLYKLDWTIHDIDCSYKLNDDIHILVDFAPIDKSEKKYRASALLQDSALWSIIQKRKERIRLEQSHSNKENSTESGVLLDQKKDTVEGIAVESKAGDLESMLQSYESELHLNDIAAAEEDDFNLDDYETLLNKVSGTPIDHK